MSHQHGPERFEESDWVMRVVVISAASLLVFMVFGMILSGITQRVVMARVDPGQPPTAYATEKRVPPAPRLQVDEEADYLGFRAREDAVLSTYQWLDKSGGVVRIPIDRAIDVVAREAEAR